ncbi:unnamed protein product [Dicrocoelium dendriticum]|nr:unnamed protein product [Dicrocoelium dendriticum]
MRSVYDQLLQTTSPPLIITPQDRALSFYKAVLCADPKNIWAAHGIGCVLAHKGFVNEARDVFAQVREATADFADVWVNIAHIYVEQKQYTAAIQMYENCIKKFSMQNNTELLQYLARAYFKANQLKECKLMLLRALHVKPSDPLLSFNLALVRKRLAVTVLQDETSSFSSVCEAITDLNMARCTFDHLSKLSEVLNQPLAAEEARACQDLLSQAKYHLDRAKSREEQERVVRKRQEDEREAQRKRQLELQQQAEQMRLERERRLEEERGRFLEKAKQIVIEPAAEERKGRKSGGGSRRRDDFIASESDDNSEDRQSNHGEEGEGNRSNRQKHKRSMRRRAVEERSGARKKARFSSSKDDGLTARQRMRVVSKEIVSESSDSSSGDDVEDEAAHEARVTALARKILSSDEDDLDQPVERLPTPERHEDSSSSLDLSQGKKLPSKAHNSRRFAGLGRSGRARGQKRNAIQSSDEEDEAPTTVERYRPPASHNVSSEEEGVPHRKTVKSRKSNVLNPTEFPSDTETNKGDDSDDGLAGLEKRKRLVASSDSDAEQEPVAQGGEASDSTINTSDRDARSPSLPPSDFSSALSEDDIS